MADFERVATSVSHIKQVRIKCGGVMLTCSATVSECGPVRTINADAITADDVNGFYAIADGVGSTAESVAASRFAVEKAHAAFLDLPPGARNVDLSELVLQVGHAFRHEFETSSKAIGTTLTVLAINDKGLRYVSVGDSPMFLLADGRTLLLTKYHTMIDQKVIIRDFNEMKSMNGSNYLYNTLGRTLPQPITYDLLECTPPFRILLCTDGFMELTSQSDLADLNEQCTTVADFPRLVARMARLSRPPDNYSAILIEARKLGDSS